MILPLAALVVTGFLAAAPFAWLLMLGLGNFGHDEGFWECLPFGALLGAMVASRHETRSND